MQRNREVLGRIMQTAKDYNEAGVLKMVGHADQFRHLGKDHSDLQITPSRSALLTLAQVSTKGLDLCFPGFSEGAYVRRTFSHCPGFYIPSPAIRQQILFHAEPDAAALYTKVDHRLQELGANFYVKASRFQEKETGLRTANVTTMRKAMAQLLKGRNRRTGEPAIAHSDRVLHDCIATVRQNTTFYNAGDPASFIPFRRNTAEVFLIAGAGHDFLEEEIVLEQDERERITRTGEIQYVMRGGQNLDQTEVILKVLENNETKNSSGWRRRKTQVVYEDRFPDPLSIQQRYFFEIALRALDSSKTAGDQAILHLHTQVQNARHRMSTPLIADQIYHGIAYLVKRSDRWDNAWTSTFKFDSEKGVFVPRSEKEIFNKAVETMTGYDLVERDWSFLMNRFGIISNAIQRISGGVAMRSSFDFDVVRQLPTLWAKLILLGLTPDQIWHALSPNNRTTLLFAG